MCAYEDDEATVELGADGALLGPEEDAADAGTLSSIHLVALVDASSLLVDSERVLGSLFKGLRHSADSFGPSRDHLGIILGPSWGHLGGSWGLLGGSERTWGPS